jgi:hypothetical protein
MRSKPLIATAPSAKTDERITELHLWAVHEGLRRTPTATLFEDFCRRLVAAGVPVWRAFAGLRTLHPQWAGYTYTWWRDRNEVDPTRRERGEVYEQDLRDSPYAYLRDVAAGRDLPLRLRRRLTGSEPQRDFPFLEELANSGATDYVAELIPVGMVTEAFSATTPAVVFMPVWLNVGRSKVFKPSCGMPMCAISLHSLTRRRGQFLLKCSTIYSRR